MEMYEQQLTDVNIESIIELPTPNDFKKATPINEKAKRTVLQGRRDIIRILNGEDDRLLLLVGPCSIHAEDSALEYAGALKELAGRVDDKIVLVMRAYFDKPRTTIGWKGFISDPNLNGTFGMEEGLQRARDLMLRLTEMGLPTATEFVNGNIPQFLDDVVCWDALGARTVEAQGNREVVSGLSMPVGCKNGTGGNEYSVKIAVDAIQTIAYPHSFLSVTAEKGVIAEVRTKGNPWGHLVLRGGEQGTNFHRDSVNSAIAALAKAGVRQELIVDCSHGNCRKQHELQPPAFREVLRQRVEENNKKIIGIMLESHLCAGRQDHTPGVDDPKALQYGVSITDPCVDWETTEELVMEAYNSLKLSPVAV